MKTLYMSVKFIWQRPERKMKGEMGPLQTGSENWWFGVQVVVWRQTAQPHVLGSFSVSSSSVVGIKRRPFSYFVLSTLSKNGCIPHSWNPCYYYLAYVITFNVQNWSLWAYLLAQLAGKESASNVGGPWFDPWVGKIPWRRAQQPTCLENSMDRGAWWAIVHGVTKSWTWLSN